MKKAFLTIVAVLALASTMTFAQESNGEIKTLFGGGEPHNGFFLSPELKFGNFNSELGVLLGGKGGWIINRTFSIGLAGYGVVTEHEVEGYSNPTNSTDPWYLRAGYGGLNLEYIHNSNDAIHFTVSTLIGAGGAAYTRSYSYDSPWDWDDDNYEDDWVAESSAFLVVEPGLAAELNITEWLRFNAGVSYRFVSYLDLPNSKNEDIGGFSGNIGFKFGRF